MQTFEDDMLVINQIPYLAEGQVEYNKKFSCHLVEVLVFDSLTYAGKTVVHLKQETVWVQSCLLAELCVL